MSLTNGEDGTSGQQGEEFPLADDLSRVSDEESLSERRVLERIQDLWDEVAEVRMDIARNQFDQEYGQLNCRRAYYDAVRNLWIGLKPHLGRASEDVAQSYLLDVDLGTVEIEPPAPIQPPESRVDRQYGFDLLAGGSWPEPVTYSYQGFVDFEEADVSLGARWPVQLDIDSFNTMDHEHELEQRLVQANQNQNVVGIAVRDRNNPDDFEEPFIVEVAHLLPRWVIERAFQNLVELMGELGMSTTHEDDKDAKTQYDDVVDVARDFEDSK